MHASGTVEVCDVTPGRNVSRVFVFRLARSPSFFQIKLNYRNLAEKHPVPHEHRALVYALALGVQPLGPMTLLRKRWLGDESILGGLIDKNLKAWRDGQEVARTAVSIRGIDDILNPKLWMLTQGEINATLADLMELAGVHAVSPDWRPMEAIPEDYYAL